MSYKDNKLFGLQEVCIYPKPYSDIESRNECDPYINGTLPLFTAPMSAVIDEKCLQFYVDNKINPILPRTVDLKIRIKYMNKFFVAFGLSEIDNYVKLHKDELMKLDKIMICIDIANGHMLKMQHVIKELKNTFKNKIIIMCGNIANPITFRYLSEAGADFIRCGIGGGNGCLTASNTGIFYPMGSLIIKCKKIQKQMLESHNLNNSPKPAAIVADGGMKNYDYIIKSLFLGADFVMCGRIFSQSWEAPGEKWFKNKKDENLIVNWKILQDNYEFDPKNFDYKKIFYGMSTKKAQQEISKVNDLNECKFKTSEGITREIAITYTINGWVENFVSYLTSAMSYTNCRSLLDVKMFEDYKLMTYAAQQSYNK